MSGKDTRLVEHWQFGENQLSVDRTMTVYDPYYIEPLVRRRGSVRADNIEIVEAEPCDPDGHYRDLLETGKLEKHLVGSAL
jgi:hypothetical protein